MDENKETIKWWAKKLSIRNILFIIYHFYFILSIIGLVGFVFLPHLYWNVYVTELYSDPLNRWDLHLLGGMIVFAIGMNFFGNLLYKEYTREDK